MPIDPHNLGPPAYKYEDVITKRDLEDWWGSMYLAEKTFIDHGKTSTAEIYHTLHVAFDVLQMWLADGKPREDKDSSIYRRYKEIFRQFDEEDLL